MYTVTNFRTKKAVNDCLHEGLLPNDCLHVSCYNCESPTLNWEILVGPNPAPQLCDDCLGIPEVWEKWKPL